MERMRGLLPVVRAENRILLIRKQRVMLDEDLAELYGVPTKILNKAVRRNLERFPEDFMFGLTAQEFRNLRSQTGTSKQRGGRRYLPLAFTEQGVAMLSSVLRSKRAVRVNVEIMRAFVRLRKMVAANVDLQQKVNELENKYDANFKVVFDAIREIMAPRRPAKRIGF